MSMQEHIPLTIRLYRYEVRRTSDRPILCCCHQRIGRLAAPKVVNGRRGRTHQGCPKRFMPAKKTIICRECGEPFDLQPRKPGRVDECPRCLAAKGSYVDPLAGCSDELRRGLYAECDK